MPSFAYALPDIATPVIRVANVAVAKYFFSIWDNSNVNISNKSTVKVYPSFLHFIPKEHIINYLADNYQTRHTKTQMSDNNTNSNLPSFPAPKANYTDTPTDLDSLTTPDPESTSEPDLTVNTQYSPPLDSNLISDEPATPQTEAIKSSDNFLPPAEPDPADDSSDTSLNYDQAESAPDNSGTNLLESPSEPLTEEPEQPLTPTPADEIELTDPVPPDLTDPVAPEMTAPAVDTVTSEPASPPPAQPPEPSPTEVPATVPASVHKSSKTAALALGGFAILATAVAALIFLQLSGAQNNLSILRSITGHQRTLPPTVTVEPTEETEIPVTEEDLSQLPTQEPSISPSATITPTLTSTPTPTPSTAPTAIPNNAQDAFSNISSVISKAESKFSSARLILITVDNVETPSKSVTKYWFRQSDTEKKYFYVIAGADGQYQIFDKQIYVTPDNNIPSLNEMAKNNGLGMDLKSTVELSNSSVIANSGIKGDPSSIYAQFIKTRLGNGPETTIWQITYIYLNRTSPVVVQIDSQAKRVVYSNIKYNLPQAN